MGSHDWFRLLFTWGPRPEPLASCAQRLWNTLSGLAGILGDFPWTVASEFPSLDGLPVESEAFLQKVLKKGVNRTDIGRHVIEELGFSADVHNYSENDTAVLGVHCSVNSQYVSNTLSMAVLRSRISAGELLPLMSVLVTCWDPDWGIVSTVKLDEALDRSRDTVEVGWITYSRRGNRLLDKGRSWGSIVEVAGRGSALVAASKDFDATDPQQLECAREIERVLNRR